MSSGIIKKALSCLAVLTTPMTIADPSSHSEQVIRRAGSQPSFDGAEQVFSGKVRVDPLFPSTSEINASGAYVTFEPSARSAWHTHPSGQHIIVTEGVGLTQEWGKPIQEVQVGDTLWCPPGVKHWHGAAPNSPMTHLVVTGEDDDGKNVVWMEKVSDAQYGAYDSDKRSKSSR